ncbi:unnamed protein product [marine sediment metagenome]|uniref:Uncharacterized protein n=1 Tax=marine sediment metagenome TaxID=412755 RepID=X1RNR7_9ZZZZ
MSDVFENKGTMAATVVVAASDSLNKTANTDIALDNALITYLQHNPIAFIRIA